MNALSLRDQVIAMFLCVGVGDALGLPVETMTAEAINKKFGRVTDYLDTAFHRDFVGSPKGTTSDDTQRTKSVACSFIRSRGFDMDDQARAYIEGGNVSTRGWGGSMRQAYDRLNAGAHWSVSGTPGGAGNGVSISVGFFAPYFLSERLRGNDLPWRHFHSMCDFARMSHATTMAAASAVVMIEALLLAFESKPPYYFRKLHASAVFVESYEGDVSQAKLSKALRGLWKIDNATTDKEIRKLFGNASSYVYESLPVALALFLRKPDSIDALYDAVNFGGDTDSVASMVGALLGARNGTTIIPDHLLAGLQGKDEILKVANEFCDTFNIN